MKIIAVDDEYHALEQLKKAVVEAVPDCCLHGFDNSADALRHAAEHRVDVAFLDIRIDELTGLEVAQRLKELYGKTNVIFVTGYNEYMKAAFQLHVSGYLEKPVSAGDVAAELENLRHPLPPGPDKGLRVQTFGNFEVFVDGRPVHFPRSKSKEVFAYLIHRRGAGCSIRELLGILHEDQPYSYALERQVQTYISVMMRTLRALGVDRCIIKQHNQICVDVEQINCDCYRFLNWDPDAVNHYTGEYMSNYDWGEFIIGYLNSKLFS